jgi:hypothetical protein
MTVFAIGDRVLCERVERVPQNWVWGTVARVGTTYLHVHVDGDWTPRYPDILRKVHPDDVRRRNTKGHEWLDSRDIRRDGIPQTYTLVDDGFIAVIRASDHIGIHSIGGSDKDRVTRTSWDAGSCPSTLTIHDGAVHHIIYGDAERPSWPTDYGTKSECEAKAVQAHALWQEDKLILPKPHSWLDDRAALARSIESAISQELAAPDPLVQLEKLGNLRSSGVLTEEEFNEAKARILGRL